VKRSGIAQVLALSAVLATAVSQGASAGMIAYICNGGQACVTETPPNITDKPEDLISIFMIDDVEPESLWFLGIAEEGNVSPGFNAGLDNSSGEITLNDQDLDSLIRYYSVKANGITVLYEWWEGGPNEYSTADWRNLTTLQGNEVCQAEPNKFSCDGTKAAGVSNVRLWGVPEPNSAILYGLAVLFTGIGIRRMR
jgi:hypothetical protein